MFNCLREIFIIKRIQDTPREFRTPLYLGLLPPKVPENSGHLYLGMLFYYENLGHPCIWGCYLTRSNKGNYIGLIL